MMFVCLGMNLRYRLSVLVTFGLPIAIVASNSRLDYPVTVSHASSKFISDKAFNSESLLNIRIPSRTAGNPGTCPGRFSSWRFGCRISRMEGLRRSFRLRLLQLFRLGPVHLPALRIEVHYLLDFHLPEVLVPEGEVLPVGWLVPGDVDEAVDLVRHPGEVGVAGLP